MPVTDPLPLERAPRGARPRRVRSAGFTLVEVLVAMLVLAVGLLGIARLSFSAVQANSSAFMRSQSSALMQEIIDNMHANRNQAVNNLAYQIAFGAFPAAPANNCSLITTCLDSDIALYDLYIWKQRLAAALPGGDGQVILALTPLPNGDNGVLATVTVQWNDSVAQWAYGTPSAVAPAPVSITVQTML
jgi:type IV pilus assembly protein PilV